MENAALNKFGERLDASTVRFERVLPGPIERVWSYLVEQEKRSRWLCGGETEPKEGGSVEMHFHNSSLSSKPDIEPPQKYCGMPEKMQFWGTVTRWDPPRVLSHTWDFEDQQSEVTYELTPEGDRVRLVLTHRRLADDGEVLAVSGGWHTHLDILEDVMQGREPEPFWKAHTPLEAEYEQRYS